MHALVAVGVNADGGRQVLGLDVAASEDGAGWLAFLRSLTARGLSGVRLVVSDVGRADFRAASGCPAGWSPGDAVVDRPEDADVALLRLQAPYKPRTGAVEAYFHAGSLAFPPQELARILAITDTVPSIVDVYWTGRPS